MEFGTWTEKGMGIGEEVGMESYREGKEKNTESQSGRGRKRCRVDGEGQRERERDSAQGGRLGEKEKKKERARGGSEFKRERLERDIERGITQSVLCFGMRYVDFVIKHIQCTK